MTNLEKLRQSGSNCPYRDNEPPISAESFCEHGCSVECREEMIEKLSRSAKGRRWLDWEVGNNEDE